MAKDSGAKITDVEIAKAVIAHEAVDCFSGKEQPKSAQPKQLLSCTGGAFWGRPGESWPVADDEEPLIPWLQIVCTEMEDLAGAYFEKKAVCFYIRQGFSEYEAASAPDKTDFVVREYGPSDALLPLARPKDLKGHPFHRVIWEESRDYPSLSKYHRLFEPAVYRSLRGTKQFEYQNRSGIKIGGWPTPVQRRQQYPGSYDLQIDMTDNFMYGDSGIGYLRRSAGKWRVAFECC